MFWRAPGSPLVGHFSLIVSAPTRPAGLGDKTDQSSAEETQLESGCGLRAPLLYPQKGTTSTGKKWRKNYFRTPCMAAIRVFIWKEETKECEITGEVLYFSLDLWKWSLLSTDMYHTCVQSGFSAKVYLAYLTEQSFSQGVHCWSCKNRWRHIGKYNISAAKKMDTNYCCKLVYSNLRTATDNTLSKVCLWLSRFLSSSFLAAIDAIRLSSSWTEKKEKQIPKGMN